MTEQLLLRLRHIAHVQTLVAQVTPEIDAINEAVLSQVEGFAELLQAHRTVIAYVCVESNFSGRI